MDEIWQRHKVFILQCAIGGIVLLIAWAVHSNLYADIGTSQKNNQLRKDELLSKLNKGEAPSTASIREQERIATQGAEQIAAMARKVSSVAPVGNDKVEYVRENVRWILENIGRPDQVDRYVGLYGSLKQTCLFELREEARTVLASRAAQRGRSIDETLGIQSGFQDDEVAVAIHGLAVVVDVVKRALDTEVPIGSDDYIGMIDEISEIRVAVRTRSNRILEGSESQIVLFPVRLVVKGDPAAVIALMRSFNETANPVNRMTVLESFVGGDRERPDSDRVRMTLNLWGLHHLGVAGE